MNLATGPGSEMKLEKAMDRIRAFRAIALLALVTVSPCGLLVRAQEASRPLTLDACVRLACEQNPEYRAALQGTVSASESAEAAKAPYYPDLAFQMSYRRFQTFIFLPNSLNLPLIAPIVGPVDSNGASVSASYALFDSGARKAQVAAGRFGKESAAQGAVQSREELALAVHRAFYALLAAQEALDVAKKDVKRRRGAPQAGRGPQGRGGRSPRRRPEGQSGGGQRPARARERRR